MKLQEQHLNLGDGGGYGGDGDDGGGKVEELEKAKDCHRYHQENVLKY